MIYIEENNMLTNSKKFEIIGSLLIVCWLNRKKEKVIKGGNGKEKEEKLLGYNVRIEKWDNYGFY